MKNNYTNLHIHTHSRIHILAFAEDEYVFYGGCENEDLSCGESMVCGWDACTSCNFEECMEMAQDGDLYAFAYGGTSGNVCRLCDKTAFDNRKIFPTISPINNIRRPWGIYQKYTHGKFVCTCIIHPTNYLL